MRLRWLTPLFVLLAAFAVSACQSDAADDGDGAGNSGTGAATSTGGGQATGGEAIGGAGTGGELAPACDPYVPRPTPPEVLIGPTGLRKALVDLMGTAQSELLLMMYQLDCAQCTGGLIDAHNRGVAVRVLLDFNQFYNGDAIDELTAAGVQVQAAPGEFNHAHAKVMIIDGQTAVVMSANMNPFSMSSERNYGVVDRDPQDVKDLTTVFERDWADDGSAIDTSCTRLILSPENSRERIIEQINGAQTQLDLAVMYVSDDAVMSALKQKASSGTTVRVLLAHPEWIDDNTATAAELESAGATARFFYEWELHAKLIIADGVPLVGSVNMSYNSLENNREVGVLVTEEAPAAQIVAQFEQDWSDGVNN